MTTAFHALHTGPEPLLLPNAWDFGSGAMLARAGFAAIGTTSLGVAVAAGLPDAQGAARGETLALARLLTRLPCPVTVDIEGGFSTDPAEVGALAAELAAAGVAGVNIEDGRYAGLADPGQQAELISAIRVAAPELFINARTDTFWLGQGDIGETLRRVRRYVEAGADGVFVPGLVDTEGIRRVVGEAGAPVNLLFVPGRHSVAELGELGVRRVSTGSLLFRAALHAVVQTAAAVRDGRATAAGVPGYAEIDRLTAAAAG
ncbi:MULTISPECIES: isocitrate lyase/phosphoenolpyruvate mutase family protein [unclassified Crossiella]|uniref:isocitrate lyase/PEP mutase family protein n=1 Tax=unclassified Crossiella TaxID=2620835 RepID=UPI001FFF6519|nr:MULTISPECIES: isocitrate lyase/phosphoenolpyruvate mutase family protein [unclassified Crossiella]MCK2239865.1 isocitrate lyase/phosphoenolpyruvate mutase family protein [Crossiella sp. S99.2]MCK2252573.1 isocitrate lyase/phosphoenolpyruvate mutase family protein [Crossiella sp. S99.1]